MTENADYIIDATTFMGMHSSDPLIRRRSLAFFHFAFNTKPLMNLEQIGLCDALVWEQTRAVQDAYYPFMDRLHSDMRFMRAPYDYPEIRLALETPDLRHLPPPAALLAAQVLYRQTRIFTHDTALLALACLQPYLGDFDRLLKAEFVAFPEPLDTLYQRSRALTINEKDWRHVAKAYLHPLDHTA
ncbi:MAG: DUF6190 family protein [Aquisalimonadaceae bacterium]